MSFYTLYRPMLYVVTNGFNNSTFQFYFFLFTSKFDVLFEIFSERRLIVCEWLWNKINSVRESHKVRHQWELKKVNCSQNIDRGISKIPKVIQITVSPAAVEFVVSQQTSRKRNSASSKFTRGPRQFTQIYIFANHLSQICKIVRCNLKLKFIIIKL